MSQLFPHDYAEIQKSLMRELDSINPKLGSIPLPETFWSDAEGDRLQRVEAYKQAMERAFSEYAQIQELAQTLLDTGARINDILLQAGKTSAVYEVQRHIDKFLDAVLINSSKRFRSCIDKAKELIANREFCASCAGDQKKIEERRDTYRYFLEEVHYRLAEAQTQKSDIQEGLILLNAYNNFLQNYEEAERGSLREKLHKWENLCGKRMEFTTHFADVDGHAVLCKWAENGHFVAFAQRENLEDASEQIFKSAIKALSEDYCNRFATKTLYELSHRLILNEYFTLLSSRFLYPIDRPLSHLLDSLLPPSYRSPVPTLLPAPRVPTNMWRTFAQQPIPTNIPSNQTEEKQYPSTEQITAASYSVNFPVRFLKNNAFQLYQEDKSSKEKDKQLLTTLDDSYKQYKEEQIKKGALTSGSWDEQQIKKEALTWGIRTLAEKFGLKPGKTGRGSSGEDVFEKYKDFEKKFCSGDLKNFKVKDYDGLMIRYLEDIYKLLCNKNLNPERATSILTELFWGLGVCGDGSYTKLQEAKESLTGIIDCNPVYWLADRRTGVVKYYCLVKDAKNSENYVTYKFCKENLNDIGWNLLKEEKDALQYSGLASKGIQKGLEKYFFEEIDPIGCLAEKTRESYLQKMRLTFDQATKQEEKNQPSEKEICIKAKEITKAFIKEKLAGLPFLEDVFLPGKECDDMVDVVDNFFKRGELSLPSSLDDSSQEDFIKQQVDGPIFYQIVGDDCYYVRLKSEEEIKKHLAIRVGDDYVVEWDGEEKLDLSELYLPTQIDARLLARLLAKSCIDDDEVSDAHLTRFKHIQHLEPDFSQCGASHGNTPCNYLKDVNFYKAWTEEELNAFLAFVQQNQEIRKEKTSKRWLSNEDLKKLRATLEKACTSRAFSQNRSKGFIKVILDQKSDSATRQHAMTEFLKSLEVEKEEEEKAASVLRIKPGQYFKLFQVYWDNGRASDFLLVSAKEKRLLPMDVEYPMVVSGEEIAQSLYKLISDPVCSHVEAKTILELVEFFGSQALKRKITMFLGKKTFQSGETGLDEFYADLVQSLLRYGFSNMPCVSEMNSYWDPHVLKCAIEYGNQSIIDEIRENWSDLHPLSRLRSKRPGEKGELLLVALYRERKYLAVRSLINWIKELPNKEAMLKEVFEVIPNLRFKLEGSAYHFSETLPSVANTSDEKDLSSPPVSSLDLYSEKETSRANSVLINDEDPLDEKLEEDLNDWSNCYHQAEQELRLGLKTGDHRKQSIEQYKLLFASAIRTFKRNINKSKKLIRNFKEQQAIFANNSDEEVQSHYSKMGDQLTKLETAIETFQSKIKKFESYEKYKEGNGTDYRTFVRAVQNEFNPLLTNKNFDDLFVESEALVKKSDDLIETNREIIIRRTLTQEQKFAQERLPDDSFWLNIDGECSKKISNYVQLIENKKEGDEKLAEELIEQGYRLEVLLEKTKQLSNTNQVLSLCEKMRETLHEIEKEIKTLEERIDKAKNISELELTALEKEKPAERKAKYEAFLELAQACSFGSRKNAENLLKESRGLIEKSEHFLICEATSLENLMMNEEELWPKKLEEIKASLPGEDTENPVFDLEIFLKNCCNAKRIDDEDQKELDYVSVTSEGGDYHAQVSFLINGKEFIEVAKAKKSNEESAKESAAEKALIKLNQFGDLWDGMMGALGPKSARSNQLGDYKAIDERRKKRVDAYFKEDINEYKPQFSTNFQKILSGLNQEFIRAREEKRPIKLLLGVGRRYLNTNGTLNHDFVKLIKSVREQGRTFVLVAHRVDGLRQLRDKIIDVLDDARLGRNRRKVMNLISERVHEVSLADFEENLHFSGELLSHDYDADNGKMHFLRMLRTLMHEDVSRGLLVDIAVLAYCINRKKNKHPVAFSFLELTKALQEYVPMMTTNEELEGILKRRDFVEMEKEIYRHMASLQNNERCPSIEAQASGLIRRIVKELPNDSKDLVHLVLYAETRAEETFKLLTSREAFNEQEPEYFQSAVMVDDSGQPMLPMAFCQEETGSNRDREKRLDEWENSLYQTVVQESANQHDGEPPYGFPLRNKNKFSPVPSTNDSASYQSPGI